jgi:hypothetical protein
VLRDSCHAALPDQPGLPQIGVGLSIGGSRRHPRPRRLVAGGSSVDAAGVVACCVRAPLSDRKKRVHHLKFKIGVRESRRGGKTPILAARFSVQRVARRARLPSVRALERTWSLAHTWFKGTMCVIECEPLSVAFMRTPHHSSSALAGWRHPHRRELPPASATKTPSAGVGHR